MEKTKSTTVDVQSNPKQRPKRGRLFPLHLTSFEHYMLTDDRPEFPMTFVVQLEFSGKIDRPQFEKAIHFALERHPLLTACIGPGKGGKDCWIAAENPHPFVSWGELNQPLDFPDGEYIDLRREIGLRIFVRHNDDHAMLTVQFHHTVCDGIGSYQFLGDVLYEYSRQTVNNNFDEMAALDPKRLRERGKASYNMNNFRLPNGKY
ncbi:MAG: hypothetical protein AAGA30_21145, partial [Planctomycetota bacterium]